MSVTLMPPALMAATGIAHSHLLYCPNCPYKIASKWKPSIKFGWCVELSCNDCQNEWFVCNFCPSNTKQYFNATEMKRHHPQIHSASKKQRVAAESQDVLM
jgi:hypothetical protein